MASWQDIPIFYGQSAAEEAFQNIVSAAESSTQRIAFFSDSRGRSPNGQGRDFMPLFNWRLNDTLGNGKTGEAPVCHVANYTSPTKWLTRSAISGPGASLADTPLNRNAVLPHMGFGESNQGKLGILNGQGVLHVLTHDALDVSPTRIPHNRSYIDADEPLVYDIFAVQQSGAPNLDVQYLRQSTPGSFTTTLQQTFDLSGLDGTGGVVKITTPAVTNADYASTPYSAMKTTILTEDTNAYMIAGRWRRSVDPGGFAVSTFSRGSAIADTIPTSHANAGAMLSVMGPWAASIIHFGVNDIYGQGLTAAQWASDVQGLITLIRGASWLNDSQHLILLSTDAPRINGSAGDDTQHDLLGSEAEAIADADEYVGIINTRLGCEDLGFTRATGATYLTDNVHPNEDGADIVARSMVAALSSAANQGSGTPFGPLVGSKVIGAGG